MNPFTIIDKYYTQGNALYDILVEHSRLVTQKALEIANAHPELNADAEFISEAAMLHDIGIFLTDAPDIECHGTRPYICHGTLVSERHTGAGLSLEDIINQNLPIPHRDMLPISIEEQIICFADKFYSKSNPLKEKSIEQIRKSMSKYGEASVARFERWYHLFLL